MEKLKLSTRSEYCKNIADRIHKTNLSLTQLEQVILDVFGVGYGYGYDDAVLDNKKHRDLKEAKRKASFNQFRDEIEDVIHQKK